METNEVLDKLPKHLMSLVIDQPYNDYTAQDHAIWRYVMRQNVKYLSKVAHGSYLDGLGKTGISLDYIPHMYGMNRILKEIGWAAVAVDGFIPPSAFMEFQAYHVLVIAADIRPIDQVEYTPAPDIIHEAAGHAPIIADPEYAAYLVRFGELGSKAFSSARDYDLYEAIRHLSIVKADPYSTAADIQKALLNLQSIEKSMGPPSEMALIRNLHWWTVEYGLIGDLKQPKIYGAGLLSSIGESFSALNNGVKKLPYTLDAMHTGFDITTKQPQLFVTPDFEHLGRVLEEFGNTMALQTGGKAALDKALGSGHTATVVYASGLQVSGTLTAFRCNSAGEPVYLQWTGPVTLNYHHHMLPGHGKDRHPHGFGSPAGKLQHVSVPPELLSEGDFLQSGVVHGRECRLVFDSGVEVKGVPEHILRKDGKNLLITFSSCEVRMGEDVLFRPEWGAYDMAVGSEIISAFPGPADPEGFGFSFPVPGEKTHKIVHSPESLDLHGKYQLVRGVAEQLTDPEVLPMLWHQVKHLQREWLLPLEMLQCLKQHAAMPSLAQEIREHLEAMMQQHRDLEWLISNGLSDL
ncbi:MAG TPA: aromatic amino acid hydroxylase [Bacteroidales bacterium]|nr:aromatic amino acid hydroxylase [Bacteroidales bacterium]HSA43693.1 aromatic amino acid hydroxylase [Bacteroidales bacterium]